MKIILKNIGSFFKKKPNVNGQKTSSNPYRDWAITCTVATLIFLLMVGVTIYLFLGIQKGTLFAGEEVEVTPLKKISSQKLEEALLLMLKREETFNELKTTRPVLTDPSV